MTWERPDLITRPLQVVPPGLKSPWSRGRGNLQKTPSGCPAMFSTNLVKIEVKTCAFIWRQGAIQRPQSSLPQTMKLTSWERGSRSWQPETPRQHHRLPLFHSAQRFNRRHCLLDSKCQLWQPTRERLTLKTTWTPSTMRCTHQLQMLCSHAVRNNEEMDQTDKTEDHHLLGTALYNVYAPVSGNT